MNDRAPPMKPTPTPDVINLVVAAREFWDANNDLSVESLALDKALEPFSSLVPYENEPHDDDFSVEPAKALEWRLNEEGWQIADTFFGGYRVERNPHDHWCWGVYFHGETGVGLNSADNFESAKAAAQADFESRVLSALSVQPAAPEGWQPIDTAPRNRTAIILALKGGRVTVGHWLDNSKTQWPWQGWSTDAGPMIEANVTHWQPLPSPLGGSHE